VAKELRRRDFLRPATFHRLMALGGVPWYLRSGKYLADIATSSCRAEAAPQSLFADSAPISKTGPANYLRFRLSPNSAIAIAARVKLPGKEFIGDHRGSTCSKNSRERKRPTSGFLTDAMAGDGALFYP